MPLRDSARIDRVFLRGWLKKNSGNSLVAKLQSAQSRYCVISRDDNKLYYYLSETDATESGVIDLGLLEFARFANDDRTTFELKEQTTERVYTFQARTQFEARAWLEAISMARVVAGSTNTIAVSSSKEYRHSGWLQKQSGSRMVVTMQKRFVTITTSNKLEYFKNDKGGEQPLDSLELEEVEFVKAVGESTSKKFSFKLRSNPRVFVFQANNYVEAVMWMDAITAAGGDASQAPSLSCTDNRATMGSESTSTRPSQRDGLLTVELCGWLGKTSHNKYVRALKASKGQRRFVVITSQDRCLRYYKAEPETTLVDGHSAIRSSSFEIAMGQCSLMMAEFVRPYDPSDASCCRFEVGGGAHAGGRVWEFECSSVPEMEKWIEVIAEGIALCGADIAEAHLNQQRMLTPACVLLHDEQGKDAFLSLVRGELGQLADHARRMAAESKLVPLGPAEKAKLRQGHGKAAPHSSGHNQQQQQPPPRDWQDAWESSDDDDDNDDNDGHDDDGRGELKDAAADSDMTFREFHCWVECLHALLETLSRYLPQLQRHDTHPARYDIMALFMREFCTALDSLLLPVFSATSPELQHALLQDVFSVIVLLSRLELRLGKLYCPSLTANAGGLSGVGMVAAATGGSGGGGGGAGADKRRSTHYVEKQERFSAAVVQEIPALCLRYAVGSAKQEGVRGFFRQHCNKVWRAFSKQPDAHIQRHQDGSFFTSCPTDCWALIHSQLLLSANVKHPLLHVLIAEKAGECIKQLAQTMQRDVDRLLHGLHVTNTIGAGGAHGGVDESNQAAGETIDLELLCAVTNDVALHLEEVLLLLSRFEDNGGDDGDDGQGEGKGGATAQSALRAQIEASFDDVTSALLEVGDLCLTQLVALVLSDVSSVLAKVFSADWLENYGAMESVLNTLRDYLADLESYLMPFWGAKFVSKLLEETVLHYTWAVLSKAPSILGQQHQVELLAAPASLGRLSRDINALNAFFLSFVTSETDSAEILELVRELLYLCQQEPIRVAAHVVSRIAEFPWCYHEFVWLTRRCLLLREDVGDEELDECMGVLALSAQGAVEMVAATEAKAEAEAEGGGEAEGIECNGVVRGKTGRAGLERRRLGIMVSRLARLGGMLVNPSTEAADVTDNGRHGAAAADHQVEGTSSMLASTSASASASTKVQSQGQARDKDKGGKGHWLTGVPFASLRAAIADTVRSLGVSASGGSAVDNDDGDDDDEDDDDEHVSGRSGRGGSEVVIMFGGTAGIGSKRLSAADAIRRAANANANANASAGANANTGGGEMSGSTAEIKGSSSSKAGAAAGEFGVLLQRRFGTSLSPVAPHNPNTNPNSSPNPSFGQHRHSDHKLAAQQLDDIAAEFKLINAASQAWARRKEAQLELAAEQEKAALALAQVQLQAAQAAQAHVQSQGSPAFSPAALLPLSMPLGGTKMAGGAALELSGKLDKLSPRSTKLPLWQNRFFRLAQRPCTSVGSSVGGTDSGSAASNSPLVETDGGGFICLLMWYHQPGGRVLNSLDVGLHLEAIRLIVSPRPLAYSAAQRRLVLRGDHQAAHKEESGGPGAVCDVVIGGGEVPLALSLSLATEAIEHYVFALYCSGSGPGSESSKVHYLRASTLDKVVRWISVLAEAGGLRLDAGGKGFVRPT